MLKGLPCFILDLEETIDNKELKVEIKHLNLQCCKAVNPKKKKKKVTKLLFTRIDFAARLVDDKNREKPEWSLQKPDSTSANEQICCAAG